MRVVLWEAVTEMPCSEHTPLPCYENAACPPAGCRPYPDRTGSSA